MPKQLCLLRHAQSGDKRLGQQDKERELTPIGMSESMQIGEFMLHQKIAPDIIFSSSASRTKATTHLVADAMKFDHEKIIFEDVLYEASLRAFLNFINNIENHYNNVMCVGHNPTISYLAEFLTKAQIGDMTTAGLAIISFNISLWSDVSQETVDLVNYVYPSMISN